MKKSLCRMLSTVLTAAVVFSGFGSVPMEVKASGTESTPIIYYQDDFESYEEGTDLAGANGSSISTSGSVATLLAAKETDVNNHFLKITGVDTSDSVKDYSLSIPLQQGGENVSYTDTQTPLWMEFSLRHATPSPDPFRYWCLRFKDAENNDNKFFDAEWTEATNLTNGKISLFGPDNWSKVIIKVDLNAKTYSVWKNQYAGDPIGGGSFTSNDVASLNLYIKDNSYNHKRCTWMDDVAIFASSEYVDVFDVSGGNGSGNDGEGTVAATAPGVYFKDDFDSYEVGATTLGGGVTYQGSGSSVTVANGADGNNQYLFFGNGTSNETFMMTIPLQQNGSDVVYENKSVPLWVEMSFLKADKDGYRHWNIKAKDAGNTAVTELVKCEYHDKITVNGTRIGSSFFDETGWKKVIMKLDLNAQTYSVWLDECNGEPDATGTLNNVSMKELSIAIDAHSGNHAYKMLVDNVAVFSSETFTTQFTANVPGDDGGDGGNTGDDSDSHIYDNACDRVCNEDGCEHERVAASHVYDNPEDGDCNVCGSARTAAQGTTIVYRYFNNDNKAFSEFGENGGDISVKEGTNGNGYLELKGTGAGEYKFGYSLNYDNKEVPLWIRMDIALEEKSPVTAVFRVKGTGSWPRTYLFRNENGVLYGTNDQNEKAENAELGCLNTQWMNLTFKIDTANDTYTAYVDGVEKYTGPHTISDDGVISLVEFYVASNANNAGSVLKIDNYEIYTQTPVETQVEGTDTPVEGEDVEMIHPKLEDIGNGIAVMAGQIRAYANQTDLTLDAAPVMNSAGTDILVSGSFVKACLGIADANENATYPLAETAQAAGKNAVVDTRGLVVITDTDIVLEAERDVKLLTLLVGYLEKGQEKNNYAVKASFTQTIIDDAAALTPVGWLGTGGNYDPAEKTASALYYLTLAAYQNADAATTNGTLCKDAALGILRHLISGGNEPFASVGAYWGHAVFASSLVLVKNTPAIYDELTQDEKDRMDWLMKGLAIAGNWGFNDANNYGTGFDMLGNFGKAWNPNYRNTYLTVVMSAAMYFGADELDAIYTSFDYETYTAKYRELGFTNILATWETTDYDGISVGKLMEEGGSCRLLGGIGLAGDAAGDDGGSGSGVKIPFKYNGYTTGQLYEIFTALIKYTYAWNVMNEYNVGSDTHCYIISGKNSPFTGQMGMMREFAATGGRSRVGYTFDSYFILNTVYANMKLFGGWDSSTVEMRQMDNRIYVGNEDLIFKMQEGYHGHSNGNQADEYEFQFESRGNKYTKDIWKNFHCMQNTVVTTTVDPDAVEEVEPAEPKDGIIEAPDGALEGVYLNNNAYFPETAFYSLGENLVNGTIEFDMVMGDGIHNSTEIEEGYFDACVMLGKKEENVGWSNVNMTIQLMGENISIRNGGAYKKTGMSFSSNHRYHIKMTFDVTSKLYSVELNRIYPEVGQVYNAENYAFRTGANELDFVDSLILVVGNQGSDFWVENLKIVTDSEVLEEVQIPEADSNQDYTIDSNQSLEIYCTGALAEFIGVFVDSVEVESAMYDLEEGSTIIRFKSEFLDSLSVGEHHVELRYTGERSASMTLNINAAEGGNTGEGGNTEGGGNTGEGGNTEGGGNAGNSGSTEGEGNTGNSGSAEDEDDSQDNSDQLQTDNGGDIVTGKTPDTGDETNIVLYVFALALASAGMLILMKCKKKEQ